MFFFNKELFVIKAALGQMNYGQLNAKFCGRGQHQGLGEHQFDVKTVITQILMKVNLIS